MKTFKLNLLVKFVVIALFSATSSRAMASGNCDCAGAPGGWSIYYHEISQSIPGDADPSPQMTLSCPAGQTADSITTTYRANNTGVEHFLVGKSECVLKIPSLPSVGFSLFPLPAQYGWQLVNSQETVEGLRNMSDPIRFVGETNVSYGMATTGIGSFFTVEKSRTAAWSYHGEQIEPTRTITSDREGNYYLPTKGNRTYCSTNKTHTDGSESPSAPPGLTDDFKSITYFPFAGLGAGADQPISVNAWIDRSLHTDESVSFGMDTHDFPWSFCFGDQNNDFCIATADAIISQGCN